MRIGIIQERKNPPDRRVVFSPKTCTEIIKQFPQVAFKIESSTIRVFSDDAYKAAGFNVVDDVSDCDVLLGVKEVPVDVLIPDKKYFFFSHTIKKQSYNRKLLQTILQKNIELYDYEALTNENGQRLVAFGRYAGIVGAYNGLRTYGLKFKLFQLPKAAMLPDQEALITELQTIKLPNIKILLTGKGNVGNGAKEMLDAMQLKKVTVHDYLTKRFTEPVYCQVDVLDYNERKDGEKRTKKDFYTNAAAYKSTFMKFAKVTDFYIAGHFYGDGAPYLFTRANVKSPDFNIKVVADVSCDIDGPVATTIRASTVANPIYGYHPQTEKEIDFLHPEAIAIMAVDNLPCELPKDASEGFGKQFLENVLPAFFNGDTDGILERANITKNGKLTEKYSYLQDYVAGKE